MTEGGRGPAAQARGTAGAPRAALALVLLAAASLASAAGDTEAAGDRTSGFLLARYATGSSSVLYAGDAWGPAGVFVGSVENLTTGYRELLVGAMSSFASEGESLTLGLAYASASESDYLQLYLLPSLDTRSCSLAGTLEWYEPLESTGSRQLWVNPLTCLWRAQETLSVGLSGVSGFTAGARPTHRAGPMARLRIRGAELEVEWLASLRNADAELRVAYKTTF